MPRPLRVLLLVLLWIIVLGGGFVAFWIRDPSLLEPAIEREIDPSAGLHAPAHASVHALAHVRVYALAHVRVYAPKHVRVY